MRAPGATPAHEAHVIGTYFFRVRARQLFEIPLDALINLLQPPLHLYQRWAFHIPPDPEQPETEIHKLFTCPERLHVRDRVFV